MIENVLKKITLEFYMFSLSDYGDPAQPEIEQSQFRFAAKIG
jgi:hypothetical protein